MLTIFKFLVINLLGFFTFSVIFFYADGAGLIPEMPEEMIGSFQMIFMGGTMIAWLAGALLSVPYLIIKSGWRLVFYFMPVVLPFLYGMGVLMFYN